MELRVSSTAPIIANEEHRVDRIRRGYDLTPVVVRQYHYLRLRYLVLGVNMVGLAVALAIILLALASSALHAPPAIPIILLIVGVIVGILMSWEMDRRK
jgi:hypothetical protein